MPDHINILPENFVIYPSSENFLQVEELLPAIKNFDKKRFCILPYRNPSKEKPIAKFFPIKKTYKLDVSSIKTKPNVSFDLFPGISKAEYIEKVETLKKEIKFGNIYEINYCVEFFAENISIDPLTVYLKLAELTKAPYSKLVKIESEYIISASPELFLRREGKMLFTKPIKGTIKRGKNEKEDEELKTRLYNSAKERTENVMAVDVARNDLSRIAQRGTVEVNKLYNIETYETVHHMVSTVSCKLRDAISFDDIVQATFPMASMTGAPKIKAMELIDKTERFTRNYYSGAMGFIEPGGDFELAVVIRSIFYDQSTKRISIAVGSAITHLCDPEKEYDECLLKANALLKALNAVIV